MDCLLGVLITVCASAVVYSQSYYTQRELFVARPDTVGYGEVDVFWTLCHIVVMANNGMVMENEFSVPKGESEQSN